MLHKPQEQEETWIFSSNLLLLCCVVHSHTIGISLKITPSTYKYIITFNLLLTIMPATTSVAVLVLVTPSTSNSKQPA